MFLCVGFIILIEWRSDAFTGVVTIDKLKKEYKKNGPPGILQLWEAIASHLQKLVEANISNLAYLST